MAHPPLHAAAACGRESRTCLLLAPAALGEAGDRAHHPGFSQVCKPYIATRSGSTVSQALALADIAERAARASSEPGGGDWQPVLADLRRLHSTTASLTVEWFEQDSDNNFWFYSALRLAGFVLRDMIERFEAVRGDPPKARAALDGLAVLPEIIDIIGSSAIRPDIDDHDGDVMIDKKLELWDKAFAAGLVKAARLDLEKLGPQPGPDLRGVPDHYDIIYLAYDDDTNEMHRVA